MAEEAAASSVRPLPPRRRSSCWAVPRTRPTSIAPASSRRAAHATATMRWSVSSSRSWQRRRLGDALSSSCSPSARCMPPVRTAISTGRKAESTRAGMHIRGCLSKRHVRTWKKGLVLLPLGGRRWRSGCCRVSWSTPPATHKRPTMHGIKFLKVSTYVLTFVLKITLTCENFVRAKLADLYNAQTSAPGPSAAAASPSLPGFGEEQDVAWYKVRLIIASLHAHRTWRRCKLSRYVCMFYFYFYFYFYV